MDENQKPSEEKKKKAVKKKIMWKDIGFDKLLLILLAGITLVVFSIPDNKTKTPETETNPELKTVTVTNDTYEKLLEERLSDLLSNVEGVGRVEVMITLKATSEKIVLTETPYTKNTTSEIDSEGGSRDTVEITQSETIVYIEGSDGTKTPYIIKEMEPEIEGIVVIAEGGDNIYTVKEIMGAVSALFNLPSHKIKVMKMKTSS